MLKALLPLLVLAQMLLPGIPPPLQPDPTLGPLAQFVGLDQALLLPKLTMDEMARKCHGMDCSLLYHEDGATGLWYEGSGTETFVFETSVVKLTPEGTRGYRIRWQGDATPYLQYPESQPEVVILHNVGLVCFWIEPN